MDPKDMQDPRFLVPEAGSDGSRVDIQERRRVRQEKREAAMRKMGLTQSTSEQVVWTAQQARNLLNGSTEMSERPDSPGVTDVDSSLDPFNPAATGDEPSLQSSGERQDSAGTSPPGAHSPRVVSARPPTPAESFFNQSGRATFELRDGMFSTPIITAMRSPTGIFLFLRLLDDQPLFVPKLGSQLRVSCKIGGIGRTERFSVYFPGSYIEIPEIKVAIMALIIGEDVQDGEA